MSGEAVREEKEEGVGYRRVALASFAAPGARVKIGDLLPKAFKDCLGEPFPPCTESSLKEKQCQAKLLYLDMATG